MPSSVSSAKDPIARASRSRSRVSRSRSRFEALIPRGTIRTVRTTTVSPRKARTKRRAIDSARFGDAEADASDGLDQLRMADLAPDRGDVDVEGLGRPVPVR